MISAEVKLCECGCGNPSPIAKRNKLERGEIKGTPLRFISGHNLGKGEKNNNWKGGTYEMNNGWVQVWTKDNPMADCRGYVLAHRLLAEKALGKMLPEKVQIHHYDKIQIVICQDDAYHKLLHRRTRALRACGHADWRKCWVCQQYSPPGEMIIKEKKAAYHRICKNKYQEDKREFHSATIKGEGRA